MKPGADGWRRAAGLTTAAAALGLALLSFFVFPGHTWLEQDTQIYVPMLEHLHDPSVLGNDMLAEQPQVAFTLYDESARALRATGLSFRRGLELEQIATRALGIWGLFLLAGALGLAEGAAWLAAGFCSLGAMIAGPQVLTFEYEPTPRAFAVPLVMCAMGLTARGRYWGAGIASAGAFLYHPPTALPFWVVFLGIVGVRREWRAAAPLGVAAAVLALAAQNQASAAETQSLFARLDGLQEKLQRMRTAYAWISEWPWSRILHHLAMFGMVVAAWARLRRAFTFETRVLLLGLPALGIASMPVSWVLLDHWKWALVPQVQPMRMLLFVTLSAQLLSAAAGATAVKRRAFAEAAGWFLVGLAPAVHPVLTDAFPLRAAAVVCALAVGAGLLRRWAPAAAVAATIAIPTLGGVVNYPHLDTPELEQLAGWAAASTPRDAVFLFADAPRSLDPGIFRTKALRAVYVDWKGGGQVNYLAAFAAQWWFRWQETLGRGFHPGDLPRYEALGISYVVSGAGTRTDAGPVFRNERYQVYRLR